MSNSRSIAIIGASADRAKFGNKAVRAYGRAGWTVYPINPPVSEIEGLRAYAALTEVPVRVDRVSLYLPPQAGLGELPGIASARPAEFWVNPGAESPELVAAARALGLEPILSCSIVAIGASPEDL